MQQAGRITQDGGYCTHVFCTFVDPRSSSNTGMLGNSACARGADVEAVDSNVRNVDVKQRQQCQAAEQAEGVGYDQQGYQRGMKCE